MSSPLLVIVGTVISALGAFLMFAARTGPEEAVSNLSKWAAWFGVRPPSWLTARSADRWGRLISRSFLSIGALMVIAWVYVWSTPSVPVNLGPDAKQETAWRDEGSKVFGVTTLDLSKLGKPLDHVKLTEYAYQAGHEQASIIWIQSHFTFFVLSNTGQITMREQDPDWTANPEHFGDDNWLRKQFHPPVGKLPPFAGVANHWLKDPAHWQWIGWRDWDCGYGKNTIHYQEFENGLVVGILHISPKVVDLGEVIFLLNTDKYYIRDTSSKPAECAYRH